MCDADGGKGSTAAGSKGVDSCSCPPGSLSTAAAGPSQVQSFQALTDQLLRAEERFAILERKVDAALEEQASLGSTAGPPEVESVRRILESWPFQRNLRPGAEVFGCFTTFIERKVRHMEMNKAWDTYEKLVKSAAKEFGTLMEEIVEHEQKMEESELPLAFRAVCKPCPEKHWGFTQPAQYSDEWSCNENKNGEVLPASRTFYVCLAESGEQRPCYTAMPSKTFGAFSEDPLASKQMWKCVCCNVKYKTRFGVIIEIQVGSNFYYVKAPIPPEHLEDLRLEQPLNPSSPEELLEKVHLVTPHKNEILRPITQDDVMEGYGYKTRFDQHAYKINASAYKDLAHFNWQQIVNLVTCLRQQPTHRSP